MPGRIIKLVGVAAGQGAGDPGAAGGPNELREFGLIERLVDAGHRVEDLGDIQGHHETRFAPAPGAASPIRHLANVVQVNRHIHACVLGVRRKDPGAFVLIVGGDHSLAIGTLAGLSDSCQRLGLIWIDAHADFNTPLSSPSGNAHGMSLAVACGQGHIELRSIADRDPLVREEDVYLFGPRDIDPGEWVQLEESRVQWLNTVEFRQRGMVKSVTEAAADLARRCDHLHLSFDIDVLDATFVPGTGTRVAGGITVDEARDILRALGRQDFISSAEFVEYNPVLDDAGRTAETTLSLIDALLAPPEG